MLSIRHIPRAALHAALLLTPLTTLWAAEEPAAPPAKGIQDNSFLIEEAYNQEAGVVQHIVNARFGVDKVAGPNDRSWDLLFTQEWPVFSQRHQFSYSVPYSFAKTAGTSVNGVGDLMLNYRLQALFETKKAPALAPRFSLILPTGDVSKGLGDDTLGYQFNLPVSKILHDRWTAHANAGFTLFPNLQGRNPVSFNAGGSLIYAPTTRLNFMLETVGEWNQRVGGGNLDRQFSLVLSPGVRYAFNFASSQLVLGLGAPIGLTKTAPDYGLFLYLSFEHRMWRARE